MFLEFIDREIDRRIHPRSARPRHPAAARRARSTASSSTSRAAPSASSTTAGRCAPRWCCSPPAASGATETLKLDACGLAADDRGRLAVDPATFQTAVPHIYAVGDVIGFPSLASTSMEQGRIAACHAFGAADARAAGILSLRHLFGARDLHRRHDRRAGAREAHPLRSRHRALPRDLARPHHGPAIRAS